MREIEKNDVDVLKLFNWKKEVTIGDGENEVTLYMRIVGDNDLQRARVYAFRKSAEMRKKLRTPDTDERVAFLNEMTEFKDKTSIIESILLLRVEDYKNEAVRLVDMPLPTEPDSDAKPEKHEEYQKEVDEYPTKFSEAAGKIMQDMADKDRELLLDNTMPELYKLYEDLLIDRIASEELNNAYSSKLAFFSVYLDENCVMRAFNDFDEFNNFPSQLKDKLVSEYRLLDFSVSELKK